MTRLTTHVEWSTHRAMRLLALAWVPFAAQSALAASAWASLVAAGLAASRLGFKWAWRDEPEARAPVAQVPVAQVAVAQVAVAQVPVAPAASMTPLAPARRRTDAPSRVAAVRRERSAPLLKAHHDAVTGLTTPAHLYDTAEPWSEDLKARGLALCVLHVGLDGIGDVTDRYGTGARDQVLAQVARRLRHLARDEDRVVRLDGADFVLLLSCPQAEGRDFSRAMSARVVSEIQRPLAYRTVSKLHVGCSVGSALWPDHGGTLPEVLSHADEALAVARQTGRGQTRLYTGTPEPIAA